MKPVGHQHNNIMEPDILDRVRSPASYLGCEFNARAKTPPEGGVHWVLPFPDAYEVGASHLGFQVIYDVLNNHEHSAADRVYAPWHDFDRELRERGLPLKSLEKDIPLNRFDIIGFSLAYELSYTNVLRILHLGGIPVRSENRADSDPLVVAGGVCTSNPEPMAPFIDAFILGEGEEGAIDITTAVKESKTAAESRKALLKRLAQIEGMYVPAIQGHDSSIRARKIADLDSAPFPVCQLVSLKEAIHDRAVVEIARGCPHGCRFCQAGFAYRPLRERSPEKIIELSRQVLENTGHSDLTMLSLSAGDHPAIFEVTRRLMAEGHAYRTAISLPSLRVGSLSSDVMEVIRAVKKTGITIAPEAGSERLRKIINKNITEEEILETAKIAFSEGWDTIKLYFMFGLPHEEPEDVREIGELVRKIRQMGIEEGIKPKINVGLSAFVPKPHTPFQWEPMLNMEEIREKLGYLRKRLKVPGVKASWSDPKISFLEGVMSRGDSGVADAIERAWQLGASFDGWGDHLNWQAWERAFAETGIDAEKMACAPRDPEEKLPWSHIKIGAGEKYLLKEKERAPSGRYTPGCSAGPDCEELCGACGGGLTAQKVDTPPSRPWIDEKPVEIERRDFFRYRLVYKKLGPARYIGHLDTVRLLQQAMRMARLPLRYSEGYHPKPRIRFGLPLPVGVASLTELMDIDLVQEMKPKEIVEKLNRGLVRGMEVTDARRISTKAAAPQQAHQSVTYRFEAPENGNLDMDERTGRVERFLDADTFTVEVKKKGAVKPVDLKESVLCLKILEGATVEATISCNEQGASVNPVVVWENIFGPMPPYSRIIKVDAEIGGWDNPEEENAVSSGKSTP